MCPRCTASLAAALAPGDRSYQDNMVLLTEIGFLSESLVQGYELKGKSEGGRERGPQKVTHHFHALAVLLPVSLYLRMIPVPARAAWPCLFDSVTSAFGSILQLSTCTTVSSERTGEDDVFHANMSHLTFSKNMPPRLIQRLLAWKQGSNWILLHVVLLTPVIEN